MKRSRVFFWVILTGAVAVIIVHRWGNFYPDSIERYYSNGLFRAIRWTLDHTFALLPVPSMYVFWFGVVLFWVLQIRYRPVFHHRIRALQHWFRSLLQFSAFFLIAFYVLWGWNYQRVPLTEHLQLRVETLDSTTMVQEFKIETSAVLRLRQAISGSDTSALNDIALVPANAQDSVRQSLQQWLLQHGYSAEGQVRVRQLQPAGVLLVWNTAGIYWPFVGEGNIDAGLHPLSQLPVMAHEMAHGYGFGDEGVCSFIAYIALYQHPNKYINYSNRLTHWKTVTAEAYRVAPQLIDSLYRLPALAGVRADATAIRRQHDSYGEWFPQWRFQVYDSYLKAQGVKGGMRSYNEVVMLVHAARKKGMIQ
jgi:Protein of unknown function (DUF3810)